MGVGVKLLILVFKYAWSNWTSNPKNAVAECLLPNQQEKEMEY